MKFTKLFTPVLAIALTAGLYSCSKDDSSPATGLDAMFNNLKTASQTFTVEAGTNDTIKGSKGTLVIFYPGSFVDANGNAITSGSINIELNEIYKPGEMILNRVNTVTNEDNLLTSGGQIHIKATRGSNQVKTTGYGIGFRQDDPSADPMAIFYGGPRSQFETSVSNDNTIIWGNDSSLNIKGTSNITNQYFFLFDSVTNFGWVNCDFFIDDPRPRTNMELTLSSSFDNMNTQVFIVMPEYNSVLSPRTYNGGTKTFGLGTNVSYHIPIGMDIKIVTLATIGDKYYLEVLETTTTAGMSTALTPIEKSEAAVIDVLKDL